MEKLLQLEQHLLGLLKQLFKMNHQPLKVKLLQKQTTVVLQSLQHLKKGKECP